MTSTIAVVHLPPGTSGSRQRLARKLGGRTLFEWIVRRVTEGACLHAVVIVAGLNDGAETILGQAPPDVPLLVLDEPSLPARLLHAADEFGAEGVIHVCADNPFIDPVLIDRLVTTAHEHPECDYVGYCSSDGRPAGRFQLGVCAEWTRVDALRQVVHRAAWTDQESGLRYWQRNPDSFCLRLIPIPDELDRHDFGGAMESEDEWEVAQALFDAMGPDGLDWRFAAGLLSRGARRVAGAWNDVAHHARPEPVGGAI